jgi:NhaP-type Na+/H+ or K+/H+ antiporter
MWWSGLRGAISFALAMTLDDTRPDHQVRVSLTGPAAIVFLDGK